MDGALEKSAPVRVNRGRDPRISVTPIFCPETTGASAFGKAVFGPLLALFAARLWLYLAAVKQPDASCLLFCARGGLRLQLVFERFLARTGLTCPVAVNSLMVSRLVAARPAVLARSATALDEIGREFDGGTVRDVIRALAQQEISVDGIGGQPFHRDIFYEYLWSDDAEARRARRAIEVQHELFSAHFSQVSHQKKDIILCDTGLYGSTVRLLRAGMADVDWRCVLLARANYKGFSTEHFLKVAGLLVECDTYSPFDRKSTLLRYWQLVEWMLEPELLSVTSFHIDGDLGLPRSNLEQQANWRQEVAPTRPGLFSGALDYIDALDPASFFEKIFEDEQAAALVLKRAVAFPTQTDVAVLTIGARSHDFGRDGRVPLFDRSRNLSAIRRSLWREGAIAASFPHARLILLWFLEAVYAARWLRQRFVRKMR